MKRSVIFTGLILLFIASVIGGLYLGYADLSLGEILHALSRGIAGKGGDDVAYAHADGIDAEAALLVTYPDGAKAAIASGEVSVRGMYGYV